MTGSKWADTVVGLLFGAVPVFVVFAAVCIGLLSGDLRLGYGQVNIPPLVTALALCLFCLIFLRRFPILSATSLAATCLTTIYLVWIC